MLDALIVIALWCSSPIDGSVAQQQTKLKLCRDSLIKCVTADGTKKPEDTILECVKKW